MLLRDSPAVESDCRGLERDDGEPGDKPEVAQVDGQQGEAQRQRGRSYKQVREGDGDTSSLLFTIDLARQHGRFFHVWIDGQVEEQLLDEGLAEPPPLWSLGTIDAVDEFGKANGGERRILIACYSHDLFYQLLNGVATTLGSDEYAGVEYKAHAANPRSFGETLGGC